MWMFAMSRHSSSVPMRRPTSLDSSRWAHHTLWTAAMKLTPYSLPSSSTKVSVHGREELLGFCCSCILTSSYHRLPPKITQCDCGHHQRRPLSVQPKYLLSRPGLPVSHEPPILDRKIMSLTRCRSILGYVHRSRSLRVDNLMQRLKVSIEHGAESEVKNGHLPRVSNRSCSRSRA